MSYVSASLSENLNSLRPHLCSPSKPSSFCVQTAFEGLIWDTYEKGKEIRIDHLKLDGRVISDQQFTADSFQLIAHN